MSRIIAPAHAFGWLLVAHVSIGHPFARMFAVARSSSLMRALDALCRNGHRINESIVVELVAVPRELSRCIVGLIDVLRSPGTASSSRLRSRHFAFCGARAQLVRLELLPRKSEDRQGFASPSKQVRESALVLEPEADQVANLRGILGGPFHDHTTQEHPCRL
ncbi:hypothetical protein [Bradyrhizobium icense]|uniref:hypothetical protein n=1 Tax=Bradyrhizobium icense TaxID=1274631 RepID=UPI0012EA4540|nr:hypothetical protein [Bradyrhizobium icense]